jgi:hypothetical protein
VPRAQVEPEFSRPRYDFSFVSAATTSALPRTKPARQPAIENDFVRLWNSTARTLPPSAANTEEGR